MQRTVMYGFLEKSGSTSGWRRGERNEKAIYKNVHGAEIPGTAKDRGNYYYRDYGTNNAIVCTGRRCGGGKCLRYATG